MTVFSPSFTEALLHASERIQREPGSTYIVEKHGKRFSVGRPLKSILSRLLPCLHKSHAPTKKSLEASRRELSQLTNTQLEAVIRTARITYQHFEKRFPSAFFQYIQENPITKPAAPAPLREESVSPSTATVSAGDTPASAATSASPQRKSVRFGEDRREEEVVVEERVISRHKGIHK